MTDDGLQLNDPQTLYRRWEDSQWSPFTIDLSRDREQWPQLDHGQRGLIYFALSSLMVAEERITTKFSGLVGAHGSEEEATFLSTQQVDEARHMQFYARFQDEVVADPATIAVHVERAREQVSDSFQQIFDVALVEAHERLVAAPADLAEKIRFVTIYHLILESTLGLTSFKFITDYLRQNDLLPGFVDGYSYIHHDETRHIGYGVWFLRETVKAHPEQADTVRQTLRGPAARGRRIAQAAGAGDGGTGSHRRRRPQLCAAGPHAPAPRHRRPARDGLCLSGPACCGERLPTPSPRSRSCSPAAVPLSPTRPIRMRFARSVSASSSDSSKPAELGATVPGAGISTGTAFLYEIVRSVPADQPS